MRAAQEVVHCMLTCKVHFVLDAARHGGEVGGGPAYSYEAIGHLCVLVFQPIGTQIALAVWGLGIHSLNGLHSALDNLLVSQLAVLAALASVVEEAEYGLSKVMLKAVQS